MQTIHKFHVPVNEIVRVSMPYDSDVLCVQMQGDTPCVWALVESGFPLVEKVFYWRGTGHDCEDVSAESYVGTVQFSGLVFHLFEHV